jgi:hypothetical protein
MKTFNTIYLATVLLFAAFCLQSNRADAYMRTAIETQAHHAPHAHIGRHKVTVSVR